MRSEWIDPQSLSLVSLPCDNTYFPGCGVVNQILIKDIVFKDGAIV
jgi:hypothetical protein